MAQRILILGSEGFIGSHLVSFYAGKGYVVIGCDLAISSSSLDLYFQVHGPEWSWKNLFDQYQFDFCINAAGNGNVGYSMTNPFDDFKSNVSDTIEILDAIRQWNPTCKYLHISSAAVYGNPASLPVYETDDCKPMSPYGWHKLMAEQVCAEYCSLFRISVAVVRPFSIYGPGLRKQLFWDTYQKYKQDPSRIELWGTGHESRDFIFIDDVIHAFDLILARGRMEGETYNVGSGRETSISDAVHELFLHLPGSPQVIFNNKTREGDPLNWRSDISNLQALSFTTSIDLSTGINRLAAWLSGSEK